MGNAFSAKSISDYLKSEKRSLDNETVYSYLEKREYERLLSIRDNDSQYVLCTDPFTGGNHEGIETMHIADFLLCDKY